MPPDENRNPSGTWDTNSYAGLRDAVFSTGTVASSPQAPKNSGCHLLVHRVWTVDCPRCRSLSDPRIVDCY
jgi:hypothetical protein